MLRKTLPCVCLTSPSTLESSLVFSKNLTAISPVTTPTLSVSACRNSWPYTRFSSVVRFKFGTAVEVTRRLLAVASRTCKHLVCLFPAGQRALTQIRQSRQSRVCQWIVGGHGEHEPWPSAKDREQRRACWWLRREEDGERLGCRRLRAEGRAAAARATVTQWRNRGNNCRSRVLSPSEFDLLQRNAVLSMLLSSATAAMAAGGLRGFGWEVRCLGSSHFRPGHEAGIGVDCDLQIHPHIPQALARCPRTQQLSADLSVLTGSSQPLEGAYASSDSLH